MQAWGSLAKGARSLSYGASKTHMRHELGQPGISTRQGRQPFVLRVTGNWL